MDQRFRILMVCLGNICRSPTAHGVMRQVVAREGLQAQVVVDSCGTHGFHEGDPPDARAQQHALQRDYDLSDLRSRPLSAADFDSADLILAMDMQNMTLLRAQCPAAHQNKLRLLTEYGQRLHAHSVPDPYFGGANGFEQVLDLVEDACEGVLRAIQAELKARS